MSRKPIYLTRLDGAAATSPARSSDAAARDTSDEHDQLQRQLQSLSEAMLAAHACMRPGQPPSPTLHSLLDLTAEFLTFMAVTDQELGADQPLPQVDADIAAADALRTCAALEAWLSQLDSQDALPALDTVTMGITLWCMRHDCPIYVADPVVNALARHANRAATRQDVAATYALMQGVIEHFKPRLAADLEQSNPERPWRLLLVNFAITGIRSGDCLLASHAFGTLNAGLPQERAGFYGNALRLAESGGLDPEMTALIGQQADAVIARH